ncbi:MAG: 2-dehydropantoate 2-reductase, partial [Thiomonas sp. 14-66-4]
MKICIFGAGAIGGLIGGQLARAGVDVSFVARGPHLQAMQAHGLRLRIDGAEHVVRVPCTSNPAELGPQDYVFITLKAHSVPGAVESMRPLLHADTAVITGVNGLPYWYFHHHGADYAGTILNSVDPGGLQWRVLGPERGIGCVLYPAADLVAPGVVEHAYGKKFPLGEPSGQPTTRIQRLHEAMTAAGFEAPIRADIRDEIWLKLWGNLCLNPISALTHATLDVIVADPAVRSLARGMMQEAQIIAERLGVRFRVGIERRLDGAGAIVGHKTSMLQDLEQRRPMEIDPLLGVIQELGQLTGQPTPLVDAVLALI